MEFKFPSINGTANSTTILTFDERTPPNNLHYLQPTTPDTSHQPTNPPNDTHPQSKPQAPSLQGFPSQAPLKNASIPVNSYPGKITFHSSETV